MTTPPNWNSLPKELKLEILSYLDYPSLRKMTFLSRDDHDLALSIPSRFDHLSISDSHRPQVGEELKRSKKNFAVTIVCKDKNHEKISIAFYFVKRLNHTFLVKNQMSLERCLKRSLDTGSFTRNLEEWETTYRRCDYEEMAKKVFCNLLGRNHIKKVEIDTNPKPNDPIWSIESIKCDELLLETDNVQDGIRLLKKMKPSLSKFSIWPKSCGLKKRRDMEILPQEIFHLEQFKNARFVQLSAYDSQMNNGHLMSFTGSFLDVTSSSIDEEGVNQLLKRWQSNEQPNIMNFKLSTHRRRLRWADVITGLNTRRICVFDDEETSKMLKQRKNFNHSDHTIEMSADGDDGKRAVVMFSKVGRNECNLEFILVTRNGRYTDFEPEWFN